MEGGNNNGRLKRHHHPPQGQHDYERSTKRPRCDLRSSSNNDDSCSNINEDTDMTMGTAEEGGSDAVVVMIEDEEVEQTTSKVFSRQTSEITSSSNDSTRDIMSDDGCCEYSEDLWNGVDDYWYHPF